MELVVLGAHGTWPRPDGATSGYLVRHDGFNLWVDLGTGTMANLQRHLDLLDVDALAISHRHPDHLLDLFPLFFARLFHPDRPMGLPLFTAPEVFDRVCALLSDQTAEHVDRIFDIRTVEPGEPFEAGPFRVSTTQMAHPVPTLGMRIEADGSTLAYTADTGPTEELIELARRADLLLSEATWLEVPAGSAPLHLSARQAGEHASRAEVGALMLTHVWPTNDRGEVLAQAREGFDGQVTLAEEGMRREL